MSVHAWNMIKGARDCLREVAKDLRNSDNQGAASLSDGHAAALDEYLSSGPDLLAAAEAAVSALGHLEPGTCGGPISTLRAAIQRARGEG